MKEAFDKDFDSLLRRHARGAAGVREDGARAPSDGSHLDADELSAFAEGVLPAPARFAAVSHLADCDRCRAVAVSLARASGFEVAPEKGAAAAKAAAGVAAAGVSGQAGWRVWLSSLFAPRVLRYAVPALALCLVGVVSFVALRSSRQNAGAPSSEMVRSQAPQADSQSNVSSAAAPENNAAPGANTDGLVARTTEEATRGPITSGTPAPQPAAPVQAGGGAGQGGAASAPAVAEVTTEQPAPPPPAGRASVASDAPAASKAGPVEEREADKRSEGNDAKTDENKEKRAAEPLDVATNNDQYAQKRAQSRAAEAQTPDGARNRAGSNQTALGGVASPPAPKTEDRDSLATRRARKAAPSGQGERSDDETVRVAETRTAAGHRFRREGDAWVDVNYKSSMPSTGVRRGTESYRVLVADMPEIGRAAEQLGGEVVIVIRGHAYRVR